MTEIGVQIQAGSSASMAYPINPACRSTLA
jgi:hypothetical protein